MADYTWNYRLVQFENERWGIREILYDAEDNMVAWYSKATVPTGEDREELLESLDRYMRASFLTHLDEDGELSELIRLETRPSSDYPWKE